MRSSYSGLTPLRSPNAPIATDAQEDRAKNQAAAIIKAGQKRRGEIADDGPQPGSLAYQILQAGRRARGEEV